MGTSGGNRLRIFKDRREAGRELAAALVGARPEGDLIVLGLPRGGVPVAYEIAAALDAPLDVYLVRKLGAPFNPELAIGAVAMGGVVVYNDDVLAGFNISESELARIREGEELELARRERVYRGAAAPLALKGKTVILADDGIATGATMRAAVMAVQAAQPSKVIVASPTASRQAVAVLERVADEVTVLEVPQYYMSVGSWYEQFPQLTDQEVVDYLAMLQQPASDESNRD